MKILPIFAPHLYAIAYPKEYDVVWNESVSSYFEEDRIGGIDEFERLFELWSNPFYLEEIFVENALYLEHPFWKNTQVTLEELPHRTRAIASDFENYLLDNPAIESKFQPLNNNQTRLHELALAKSKRSWLRLYAIKISENRFLVTGGCIKFTDKDGWPSSHKNGTQEIGEV